MSGTIDPYHRWLGISSKDQPPNHYRLLGTDVFESDTKVVRDVTKWNAAMFGLTNLARALLSRKILNEIAVARTCLLDPSCKASECSG
jgi:hypothetical protein